MKDHKLLMNNVFCLFAFLTPLTVSSWLNGLTPLIGFNVLLSLIMAYFSWLSIFKLGKIYLLKESKVVITCVFIPIILSGFVVIINMLILNNQEYLIYIKDKLITRLVNYFLFLSIFLLGNILIVKNDEKSNLKIIKFYLAGIFVLACIGIWQFLNFYYGIPIFNFHARTHIHGIGETSNLIFNKRLTSLASEPSYLAPFLIDGLIIGLATMDIKQYIKYILIPLGFVLIFSYSSGGYINIISLIIIILLIPNIIKSKHKIKFYRLILPLAIGSIFFWKDKILNYFYPFIGRLGSLITLKGGRTFSSVMPIIWIMEESLFNILFGFGPGSYKYASLTKLGPNGGYVNETSNNIFGDITFEMGIIGLVFILVMFIYLLRITYINIKQSKYKKIAFVLVNHLMISSMYRADYVLPRFWLNLIIIILLIRLDNYTSKIGIYNKTENKDL